MIGRTLGSYRIIEQIGLGGMATVYKAYEPATDRYVALKILPRHFSADPQFRERFQREAKAIAKLEHLHILPLFAYGEEDDIAYMSMRYLPAGALTDRIRQGPLPLAEVSRLLGQVAGALDYAHAHGVLHRDVKPSNVLLDAGGNAYLTDFGIAKMVEATLDLTGAGILGTPAYMSPEQCRGSKELTPASDIYSLGIVLYEMVIGRAPFQAETPVALLYMQLHDPLPPPRQLRPDLPEAAERVILKALAKEPEARFATAEAMAAAFTQAVTEAVTQPIIPAAQPATPIAAPSPPTLPQSTDEPTLLHPAKPSQRKLAWLWPALAGVGLLVVIAAILFWQRSSLGTGQPAAVLATLPVETPLPPPSTPTTAPAPPLPPPSPPIPPEGPPAGIEAELCGDIDRGSGLCLTPLQGGPTRQILADLKYAFDFGPSWSPDGRQLVFSALKPGQDTDHDHTLYIVNADGSGLKSFPTFGNDVSPSWSPDGQWLAFHHNGDLAIVRPDGSDFTEVWLSEGKVCTFAPQWSPDSRQIVVSMNMRGCGWTFPMTREVWVIPREGNKYTRVASITHPNEDCVLVEAVFSPDGRQVAYTDEKCKHWLVKADGSGRPTPLDEFPWWWFSSIYPQWRQPLESPAPPPVAVTEGKIVEPCEDSHPPQICVRDDKTGQVKRVTDDLEFESISSPAWSPDGRQIVFNAGSDPETQQYDHKLYLINADGSGLKQITRGDTNDILPAWSPDGRWLAFHRNCALWLIHPNGSGAQILLTNSETFCALHITWSPDSRQIAFLNMPHNSLREMWVINQDGSSPHVVHTFERPLDAWGVAWSPDGRQIACWYNENGKPKLLLLKADGSGEPEEIEAEDQMPWSWRSDFWPQWGKKE